MPSTKKSKSPAGPVKNDPFLMLTDPAIHKDLTLHAHATGNGKGRVYKSVESSPMSRPRKLFDVFEHHPQTGELTMIRDTEMPPLVQPMLASGHTSHNG